MGRVSVTNGQKIRNGTMCTVVLVESIGGCDATQVTKTIIVYRTNKVIGSIQ